MKLHVNGLGYWYFLDEDKGSILNLAIFSTKARALAARELYRAEFNKEVDDYNELLDDYNEVVKDFNEFLTERVEELQDMLEDLK